MGVEEHRKNAPKIVTCAVVTVSDSRTVETDESGKAIMKILKDHQHKVKGYTIVKDDKDAIQKALGEAIKDPAVSVIVFNGGTGVTSRDNTIEALQPFAEKTMPGFGELFRSLSFEQIGPAAMLSRAMAFVSQKKIIFALPGSTEAVKLATERLIAHEIGHMISEVNR